MKILREVTEWLVPTPNHDYVLNDAGKLVAYRKNGKGEWSLMKKPKMFSKSYRKFQTLEESYE
jgi:hypothetical protein|tara:strand:- start:239 stop:427 length:189 start_codon:yes stop_codon:yes gene_type:complete